MSKEINIHHDQAWQARVRSVARGIRVRVLEHTIKSNGGYLSQGCSSAEIFATLYTRVMRLESSRAPMIPAPFPGVPSTDNPHAITGSVYNGPKGPDLDRLFVSPAHYALVLYATLIEVGRMAPEALDQFNRDGSTVEMIGAEHSPGFECMAGSLGQTLSQAGGVALARKLRRDIGRVWVLMSDGEMQEGQTWEALTALSFFHLDNISIYVDANGQQCDGKIDTVMNIEPLKSRLEAFGARVVEIDGHDVEALAEPALWPRDGRPLVVLARTDPCYGLDLLRERAPKLHYVRFKNDEERQTYQSILARLQREVLEVS